MSTTLFIAMSSLMMTTFVHAQSEAMVSPTSPEWTEFYDPPYKVPTEIPVDSDLRKNLFALLRAKATPQYRFSGSLKAYKNWAVFFGRTVDEKGKSLKNPPHDNDDCDALWLRTSEGWKLVDYGIGHSDAIFIIWSEKYGTPPELLGIKPRSKAEDDR